MTRDRLFYIEVRPLAAMLKATGWLMLRIPQGAITVAIGILAVCVFRGIQLVSIADNEYVHAVFSSQTTYAILEYSSHIHS